eukprot:CAMPEP_0194101402 /NCGR_PEP_ID=MMETSP0150-20130528/2116_1 /TAXON_ID=122233 /ORGANISM="Chaetoceros debilis, Strain MM31A-1" /LENGTH=560 /DNA_ID=CAMNT_0038788009 /DNA_START=131 /DNA_END=1813 /DNA_ORIENTATION=-
MGKFSSIPAGDQDNSESTSFNDEIGEITSSGRSNILENTKERLSNAAHSVKNFAKDPKGSIKYNYADPKSIKYAMGVLLLLLITIVAIVSTGSGGSSSSNETDKNALMDSNNASSNSGGDGSGNSGGSGSGSGSGSGKNPKPTPPSPTSSSSAPWEPVLVNNAVLESILDLLDTTKGEMTFPSRIERDVTYLQRTYVTTQTNSTEYDDEDNVVGTTSILEAFVEFDNIMTVKDTKMAGELIEYEVTRFATEIVNAEGEDYSLDSKEGSDMDDMTELFFNDVIGRLSTIRLNKYGKVEYTSDEEEYLESLEEIAPGMSAYEQFEQTERMAGSLPLTAVKPEDTWELKMDVKGLEFNGSMKFLGYATYGGVEVAVVEVNAVVIVEEFDQYYEEEPDEDDDLAGRNRNRNLKLTSKSKSESSKGLKLNLSKSERQNLVRQVLARRRKMEGEYYYNNATESEDPAYYEADDDTESEDPAYYEADGGEYYNSTDAEMMAFGGMEDGIIMRDATMAGLMFWDTQHAFPRWALHELSMLIEISNPFEPGEVIEIPSYQQVEMYMELK